MADNEEANVKKGPGLMGIVKAVALVSVLVVVEVVAAGMLIPTAKDTETLAQELAAAQQGDELDASEAAGLGDSAVEDEETVEVEIGEFSFTRYNPKAEKTTNIDLELFAIVLAEEQEQFTERFEDNENRVREQVMLTLHGSKTTDLTSPELGLIKRKILEKVNHALGKPLVRQVLIPQFNFVER